MTAAAHRRLLEEAYRRFGTQAEAKSRAGEGLRKYLGTTFAQQRGFILDPAREKAARCTRRAGKTNGAARYLVKEALSGADAWCFYIGLTRERAKDLMWPELKRANQEYSLGLKLNEVELSARVPGGGTIKLTGADKAKEIEKYRGYKLKLAIIDESQSFGAHLHSLVDDVLTPALMDYRGTLAMLGTPSATCAGLFFEATADNGSERKRWSAHRWSVLDNPFVPHARIELERIKEVKGWTDETPTYRREWLGEWVRDDSSLVYRYDPARNSYDALPTAEWEHVLGLDLGYEDATAIVVWAFNRHLPELYEVETWKASQVIPSAVAAKVTELRDKYQPYRMVADTGGGGKAIVEEFKQRYGLNFLPAEKKGKFANIELLNDDLLAGRVLIRRNSPLADEWRFLQKDPDAPKDKPAEDPRFENHAADAALYAWREAKHYTFEPLKGKPAPGSRRAHEEEEKRLEEALESQASQRDWWEE